MIEVSDLAHSFGRLDVLRGISLKIRRGESYVIIGGSGSGKSVLVKCILGLIKPKAGTVKINGMDTATLSRKEMHKTLLKCGVLYQGGALFDSLNVIDNISFGLVYGYGKAQKEAYKIAMKYLEAVDLGPEVARIFPAELSGGMRKRVALARALATDPDIIFFDEPTTGLDPITTCVIDNLIVKCTKEVGISALSITHDIASMKRISDTVGLIHDGEIIWEGSSSDVDTTDDPHVRQFVDRSLTGPFTKS
ncbi:MAG: ATP-binding cassette domain-containing protein [Holosporales bacterium]|nr:ATP-binding cassette domain-containing protein [Holosporales bacterium]